MKIYQVSVLVSIFSLLHIIIAVIERKSNFSRYSDFTSRKNKFLNFIYYKFYDGTESRKMHPPNKPHPDEGHRYLISNIFPKIV